MENFRRIVNCYELMEQLERCYWFEFSQKLTDTKGGTICRVEQASG
jgi:hypothetical protein